MRLNIRQRDLRVRSPEEEIRRGSRVREGPQFLLPALLDQLRHETGPRSLVRGVEVGGVAVEVLVEQ
jgi:hypothetical protein